MIVNRSLVFGTIVADSLSAQPLIRSTPVQEFVRDEVVVRQAMDRYEEISNANRAIAEGKSLALEAAERLLNLRRTA